MLEPKIIFQGTHLRDDETRPKSAVCVRDSGYFDGFVVVVLAFVFLLIEEREANTLELSFVLFGSKGS